MDVLLTALTRALEGQPAIALLAAFVWGLASLLLSPCHLTSIPLVVGFVSGRHDATTVHGARVALAFSLGLLTTIAAIGMVTAAAGRMMGDVGRWANYIVSLVFFVTGLSLLDVIRLSWTQPAVSARLRGGGLGAALGLGLVFGLALGPCTFAYMAPVLGVTFAVAASSASFGVVLIVAFGLGHCSLIVVAGAAASWVRRYLRWTETSRGLIRLRYASGLLVLAGGVYLVYSA